MGRARYSWQKGYMSALPESDPKRLLAPCRTSNHHAGEEGCGMGESPRHVGWTETYSESYRYSP